MNVDINTELDFFSKYSYNKNNSICHYFYQHTGWFRRSWSWFLCYNFFWIMFENILYVFILDEDECKRKNNDCNDVNTNGFKKGVAGCRDSDGSYACVCSSGYTYNETTRVCTGKQNCIDTNISRNVIIYFLKLMSLSIFRCVLIETATHWPSWSVSTSLFVCLHLYEHHFYIYLNK